MLMQNLTSYEMQKRFDEKFEEQYLIKSVSVNKTIDKQVQDIVDLLTNQTAPTTLTDDSQQSIAFDSECMMREILKNTRHTFCETPRTPRSKEFFKLPTKKLDRYSA